jgi:cysteine-rich repeat protein
MLALPSLAAVLAAGVSVSPFMSFHLVKVKEVYPGSDAAPNAQFILLQMPAPGENFVGGKQVRVHDAAGAVVGTFTFPGNVPNGANQATILVATPEALAFFAPGPPLTADLMMTPSLPALGGKVCFHDPVGGADVDCMAYGGYVGSSAGVGVPDSVPVGLIRGVVLERRMDICGAAGTLEGCDDTDDSANDFVYGVPDPRNNAGVNGVIPFGTCGNFNIQSLEQCDDGNLMNGDGCTNTCVREPAAFGSVALAVNTSGNGVLEPGEAGDMVPTWRNASGGTLALTAGLSSFTGPPASYAMGDAVADYGVLSPGASASCTATANCYAVSATATPTRPATHWDATAAEVNVNYGFKNWAVHIGQSFSDVPTTSAFYRFVETILHRNVTGGSGPGTYGPAGLTTREQMAVFVLRTADPGLNPPACAPPNLFADVPETSPFCRWIEELASRGAASGCGGGNYCPTTPVSRDQMAVFVLRTLDPTLTPPPCPTPSMFLDVPATNPFCRWIEELARRQVVSGCGGGNYCPTSPVTREQMSVFLVVTFGLTLYGV